MYLDAFKTINIQSETIFEYPFSVIFFILKFFFYLFYYKGVYSCMNTLTLRLGYSIKKRMIKIQILNRKHCLKVSGYRVVMKILAPCFCRKALNYSNIFESFSYKLSIMDCEFKFNRIPGFSGW